MLLGELTLCNHKMEDGWLLAISYFENLKTLRFLSCKRIDGGDELDEHWGACPAVEKLHFEKCQLRDKRILRVLFLVCHNAKEVVFQNCWGLNDDMFITALSALRYREYSIFFTLLCGYESKLSVFRRLLDADNKWSGERNYFMGRAS